MSEKEEGKATHGGGNVFADLGLEDAEELLAKSGLAILIADLIKQRRLTQGQAARTIGIDQPRVSRLVRGELYGFSTDQLMRALTALGHDVSIVVGKKARRGKARGKLTVEA